MHSFPNQSYPVSPIVFMWVTWLHFQFLNLVRWKSPLVAGPCFSGTIYGCHVWQLREKTGSCTIFNFCSFALFFYFWFCFLLMFNTFFRCMYWCTGSYSPLVATATLNLTQVLPLSPFPPTTKKCRKLMKPEKTADLCRHHWFPQCREIPKWRCVTTQIWAELLIGRATWELCFKQFGWSKDVAWPSTTQIWVVTRHQWEWNFCAPSSDVVFQGKQWWHFKMLAVFSG